MSEETIETPSEASSTPVETSQSTESQSFDVKAAVDSIGADLFGKKEPEEPKEDKEPKEKNEPKQEVKNETQETPEKTEEAKEDGEKDKVVPKERPASWKKDMQGVWDGMSKEAQEYVIQREEQMKQGLVKDRDDAVLGRTMRDVIAPYQELLKAQGIPEKNAVANMMRFHHALSTAPMEQRKEAFSKLAQSYGLKFDGQGQSQEIDPIVKNLTNELNGIKSYLSKSQEQAKQAIQAKVTSEVDAFASDHPYFDDVADEISIFLDGDKNMTLQQAYDKAVWANPLTRQKEMDRLQQEKDQKLKAEAEKKKAEAQKAKAVNVKSKDTGRVPTAPKGTMFDTLEETYREIKQRRS